MIPEHTQVWTEIVGKSGDVLSSYEGSLSSFVRRLRNAGQFPDKHSCPWIKLAKFGDKRSKRGSLRTNENVLQVFGVEGDYDGEVMTIEEAQARLQEAGLIAILYTTPSNLPGKPRWRVMAPTSVGIAPKDRAKYLARLNGVLGGILASESFTLSQGYFFGDVGTNEYRVLTTEGAFIDTMSHLDVGAISKGGMKEAKPPKTSTGLVNLPTFDQLRPEVLADIDSALDLIPSDDRARWVEVCHALKTVGEAAGWPRFDEWSKKSDKYDPVDTKRVWDSAVPTATSYRAIFVKAEAFGWINPRRGAVENRHPKLPPTRADTNVVELFQPLTLNSEDVAKMDEAEFLIPNMIVRGHVAAYPSPGNGGKTTIFVYLCETLAKKGLDILYINVDGSPSDLKRHHAHSVRHGYKVVAPDAKSGRSTEDVVAILESIAAGDADCRNLVLIIDTLKKFLDVINKSQAKSFYKLMRSLTVKGATICLLAHTNKYTGEDGKQIFEGTADLRNDLDELIYLDSFKNESNNTLEVTTRPDKVRAEFAPKSFTIHLPDRSVTEPDAVINILAKDDREILNLAKEAIASGLQKQKDIVDYVVTRTEHGAKKIRKSLHFATQHIAPEISVEKTGAGKELRYSLAPRLAQTLDALKR